MRDILIPIGIELERISKDICTKIEKRSTYYSFLTADEILLLRKISAKLTAYSYTGNATEVVGKSTLRPLIPNLSYMADNFYIISQLGRIFQQLQCFQNTGFTTVVVSNDQVNFGRFFSTLEYNGLEQEHK